jgi:cell division protein FtsB
MKKRPLLFILLFVFLVMGLLTFFGEKGILHLLRLKRELTRIQEENQRLREEVKRLQQEKRYIEEIARRELGMVKEGEVIYQFESPNDKKKDK